MYSYKEWMVRTYDTTSPCMSDCSYSFGNYRHYRILDKLARDIDSDENFPEPNDFSNFEDERKKTEEYIRTKYQGNKAIMKKFVESWHNYETYERIMQDKPRTEVIL